MRNQPQDGTAGNEQDRLDRFRYPVHSRNHRVRPHVNIPRAFPNIHTIIRFLHASSAVALLLRPKVTGQTEKPGWIEKEASSFSEDAEVLPRMCLSHCRREKPHQSLK